MAKPVLFFLMRSCPYCLSAVKWLRELQAEEPRYQAVEMEVIDEIAEARRAAAYNYYLVPTFYVDNVKVHEGVASKEIVRGVLERALA